MSKGHRVSALVLVLGCLTCSDDGGSADGDTGTTSDGGSTGVGTDGGGSTTTAECGNGIVEEGEECDLGFANDDEGECTTGCMLPACGDGFVGPAEDCDDGNTEDGDDCPADCVVPLEEVWSDMEVDGGAWDVALDLEGNLVVVGADYDPDSESFTAWIRKLDPDGNELWMTTFHGEADEGASPDAVAVAPDGDLVVVGRSTQAGTNFGDAWVAGYASDDGSQLWSHTHDDSGFNDWLAGVAVDAEGNAYLAGAVYSGSQNGDALVLKVDLSALDQGTDLAAATIWEHRHGNPAGKHDGAADIVVDDTGSATVIGTESAEGDTPFGDFAIWIRRLDTDGSELWTDTEAGLVEGVEEGLDIAALASGDVVATGYLSTAGSVMEPEILQTAIWIAAYDDQGEVVWTHTVESDLVGQQAGRGIAVDGEDMVVVVGSVPVAQAGCDYNDCPLHPWVGAYDQDGTPLWTWEDQATLDGVFRAAVFDQEGFLYVVGTPGDATPGKALVRKYEVRAGG